MAIIDDISIAANGDIRYTGTTANYTVIELHRFLGDLMDDAQASGDNILDITDATASDRSTDNIITLNAPYNIDDILSEHLYDGSIIQDNGDTIYDGFAVFAQAGTPLELIQNNQIVGPNFWTTSLNPLAASGISHRFMVKTRTGGADIDGRRLIAYTRAFGNSFTEFKVAPTARGNNTIALNFLNDLNNATAAATVKGWTTITNTTEGYALIDVNNDTTDELYYSEWNIAGFTKNQFYERMKYISAEPTLEDSNADTGSDFQVGNATITGQGQGFAVGANNIIPIRARFQLKKVGSPTGNITCNLYAHTGTFGSTGTPTGASLVATATLDPSTLTTAYLEKEFNFTDTWTSGAPTELTASTNYFVTLEKVVGDGSNYVDVRGLASSGTHGGNRAQEVGTWSAAATDDLWFEVDGTPQLYNYPGCQFRGITHEFVVDTPTGTFNSHERVSWPTGSGQMVAINSTTAATRMWVQLLTGVIPGDGDTITGTESSATVDLNVTVTERTLSFPFMGVSTGSALIGAYGFGIEKADLAATDSVTDLDDAVITPPNNVTFTTSGLVSGEDRLLVAPLGYIYQYDNEATGPFTVGETLNFTAPVGVATLSHLLDLGTTGFMVISEPSSGAVPTDNSTISGVTSGATADVFGDVNPYQDVRQMNLTTALTSGTEVAVVVNAIPTDTPQVANLRIQLDTDIYKTVASTSWTGTTFTIPSTDFSGANQAAIGNGVYIAYVDKLAAASSEAFTLVYDADRNLFIRARDGGTAGDTIPIKTAETTGTLGSAGGSATVTRISDA